MLNRILSMALIGTILWGPWLATAQSSAVAAESAPLSMPFEEKEKANDESAEKSFHDFADTSGRVYVEPLSANASALCQWEFCLAVARRYAPNSERAPPWI
jgi:hypothetical protein